MAIPDFQTVMLPLLRLVAKEGPISTTMCQEMLGATMGLTPAERSELLDSGTQTRWGSRVSWAGSYLFQAGLVSRPQRGVLAVTDDGKALDANAPDRITIKYPMKYPSFVAFRNKSKAPPAIGSVPAPPESEITPMELLESTYIQYRAILAQEILTQTRHVNPAFFERMVVQLLVAMGYGGSFRDAALAIGKSGDGGIDGIIKEDRLGLDFVAVQAKRWEQSVGREVVQAFAGSLMGHGASKGVLITTSTFTAGAQEYAAKLSTNKIVLIEGDELAELMLDFGIGVTDVSTYRIQRVDQDYFEAT